MPLEDFVRLYIEPAVKYAVEQQDAWLIEQLGEDFCFDRMIS